MCMYYISKCVHVCKYNEYIYIYVCIFTNYKIENYYFVFVKAYGV